MAASHRKLLSSGEEKNFQEFSELGGAIAKIWACPASKMWGNDTQVVSHSGRGDTIHKCRVGQNQVKKVYVGREGSGKHTCCCTKF